MKPPTFEGLYWQAESPADWLQRLRHGVIPSNKTAIGFMRWGVFVFVVNLALSVVVFFVAEVPVGEAMSTTYGIPVVLSVLLAGSALSLVTILAFLIPSLRTRVKQERWRKTLLEGSHVPAPLKPVFASIDAAITDWERVLNPKDKTSRPILLYDPNIGPDSNLVVPVVIQHNGHNAVVISKRFIATFARDSEKAMSFLAHEYGHCLQQDGKFWLSYKAFLVPFAAFTLSSAVSGGYSLALDTYLGARFPEDIKSATIKQMQPCLLQIENLSASFVESDLPYIKNVIQEVDSQAAASILDGDHRKASFGMKREHISKMTAMTDRFTTSIQSSVCSGRLNESDMKHLNFVKRATQQTLPGYLSSPSPSTLSGPGLKHP